MGLISTRPALASSRAGLAALAALIGVFAAGCSEELGPERFPTARVSGQVFLGGKPVAGGFIDFFPGAGTQGNLRSARIRSDGSFEADRVPIGSVAIRVMAAPIPPSYSRLFDRFPALITRTISAEPSTPLRIDLAEEAVRARAEADARVKEYHLNNPSGAEP